MTFREVFDKVVADYHGVPTGQPIQHPPPNFGGMDNLPFGDLDPEGKYVISTRVRVGRSVDGIPFPPLINLQVSSFQLMSFFKNIYIILNSKSKVQ